MNNTYDLDAYYELMKHMVDIPIQEDWEPTIKMHLATAAKMATIIEETPIDRNSIDLSNTFYPGKANV